MATVTVVLFIAGIPPLFTELRTVCSGTTCEYLRLNPHTMRELQELGLSARFYATYFITLAVVAEAIFLAVAAVIFWRKSDERMALFVSIFLVTLMPSTSGALDALAAAHPAWWLPAKFVGFFGFASLGLFFCLFPNGRFVPRWTLPLAITWATLNAGFYFFPGSPADPGTWSFAFPLFLGLLGTMFFAQIYRYARVSGPVERQQTKWIAFGSMVAVVATIGLEEFAGTRTSVLYTFAAQTMDTLTFLLIPLSIGIAILRYRLWDIDVIINRTLVYGALTVCVVGVYVLVVGYLGTLFRTDNNLLISLVATGIVAMLFQPLRYRLQRAINRLMYGERDDPYVVLSRLGERLEGTLAPDAALGTIVETIAQALKLPYAAITLEQDGEFVKAAEHGEPVNEPVVLPLAYQGEPVGQLILAPRAPGESFSTSDKRLLEDIARQAGVAAHAVRLTADLQRSRERLVTTREEERRRLRRDLHDGLGPRLAAQTLKIGSARSLYPRDPAAADALLSELEADMESAISDIRRLVYDLRPPALDELGLVAAIHEAAAQYATNRLRVNIDAPESLPPLPAAVEVAAYRITQEALTNVVRHAEARNCEVRLSLGRGLELEIIDDGVGLPEDRRPGVGLTSMQERAAELGGRCVVEPFAAGGTRVLARLPLPGNGGRTEEDRE